MLDGEVAGVTSEAAGSESRLGLAPIRREPRRGVLFHAEFVGEEAGGVLQAVAAEPAEELL